MQNLPSNIRLGIDEVDEEESQDVYYIRKRPKKDQNFVVHLSKLKAANSFVNSPANDWGKDEEFETETEMTELHSARPNVGIEQDRAPGRTRVAGVDSDDESDDELVSRSRRREGGIDIIKRSLGDVDPKMKMSIRNFTEEELKEKKPKTKLKMIIKKVESLISYYSRRIQKKIDPFQFAVDVIEKTFGTGIASLYELWTYIIYMNIAIFITMFIFLILPWILRTDIHWKTDKLDHFLSWDFVLGLAGIREGAIGKTFFFYEGYGHVQHCNSTFEYTTNVTVGNDTITYTNVTDISSELTFHNCTSPFDATLASVIPYEFRFFYPATIILNFLICLIILVISIGRRLRVVSKVDKTMKFSTGILSLWDHSVTGNYAVQSQKKAVASQFLEYIGYAREKSAEGKKRSTKETVLLVLRRGIGWTVSAILLIGGPFIIFVVTAYYKGLNKRFPYTTIIIFSAINISFPKILDWMVLLENYTAKTEMYNRIIRKFIMKTSGLLSLIIRVLTSLWAGIINPSAINPDAVIEQDSCPPRDAGVMFWQLLVSDFITSFIDNIVSNYLELMVNRGKKKSEFNTSSAVNRVIYRQSLIWIGSILSPMIPFLAVITNTILFYARWFVMNFTMRFPKKPISNHRGNIFNQSLLLISLLLTMIPTVLFFAGIYKCGPAYHFSLAEGLIIWRKFSNPSIVGVMEDVFEYVWIAFAVGMLLSLITVYLVYQRLKMFEERFDDQVMRLKQERDLWEKNYRMDFQGTKND